MAEIQRLMGCLCFVRRPGASPYADLMAPSLWSDVAREFSRQCCGLLGQVRRCIAQPECPALACTHETSWRPCCGWTWRASSCGSAAACWDRCADKLPRPETPTLACAHVGWLISAEREHTWCTARRKAARCGCLGVSHTWQRRPERQGQHATGMLGV